VDNRHKHNWRISLALELGKKERNVFFDRSKEEMLNLKGNKY
jgi:hypothetical protein